MSWSLILEKIAIVLILGYNKCIRNLRDTDIDSFIYYYNTMKLPSPTWISLHDGIWYLNNDPMPLQ